MPFVGILIFANSKGRVKILLLDYISWCIVNQQGYSWRNLISETRNRGSVWKKALSSWAVFVISSNLIFTIIYKSLHCCLVIVRSDLYVISGNGAVGCCGGQLTWDIWNDWVNWGGWFANWDSIILGSIQLSRWGALEQNEERRWDSESCEMAISRLILLASYEPVVLKTLAFLSFSNWSNFILHNPKFFS